ncbi:MAG: hypothetical protein K6F50_10515 [Kiritimatiellae bacterium]|nr:hypothetical protein [Kiritimatiellia bacterium]
MKRCLSAIAVAFLSAAGYAEKPAVASDRPIIPENTVLAAYVDLEAVQTEAPALAEMLIAKLPSRISDEFDERYRRILALYNSDIKGYGFRWAAFAASDPDVDTYMPRFSLAVRCDCDRTVGGMTLKDRIRQELRLQDYGNVEGFPALSGRFGEIAAYCVFVDGKYVVASDDFSTLSGLVRRYARDGRSDAGAFGSLCDLERGTVARIRTAKLMPALSAFHIDGKVGDLLGDFGDRELADMVKAVGCVTLDVKAGREKLGLKLSLDAGSQQFARVVESAFVCIAFAERLGCAAMNAVGAGKSDLARMARGEIFGYGGRSVDRELAKKFLPRAAALLRNALVVDRDGFTVTAEISAGTNDVLDLAGDFFHELVRAEEERRRAYR